jgi:hypothetical protein
MKSSKSAYALRIPTSIKAEAERLAAEEGTSLNQFVTTALAEKVSALRTARYFAARREEVDWQAFDRLMSRNSGEQPRAGDEMSSVEKPSRSKKQL